MSEERAIATRPEAPPAPLDAWDRWPWVWQLVFYGLLCISTVLAFLEPAGARIFEMAGLAIVFGVWNLIMVVWAPYCHERVAPRLVYFAGAFALWAALVSMHPAYYLLLSALYMQIYSLLRLRWAITLSAALSALVFLRGFDPANPWSNWVQLLIMVILVLLGSLVGFWVDGIIRQSHERRRLIEELQAARHELATVERQAGVLEERQRLAREIHDTLAQGFTSIVMHLEVADQALPPETTDARRHLDQARRTARESLAEARRLVWALRPEQLEQASLPEALERLARRWTEENGLAVSAAVTGTPRLLAPDVEVTLLRAAQEALANVRKHAGACQVTITLSYMGDMAALDVQDDGGGFDPLDARAQAGDGSAGGFGLLAMRQRVEQLGGTLTIESAPGEGTTLVVEIPA